MKILTLISFVFLMSLSAFSQENPVTWNINQSRSEDGSFNFHIKADIRNNWYVYGMNLDEGGPLPLKLDIKDKEDMVYNADIKEVTPAITVYDDVFTMNVSSYQGNSEFVINYVPKTEINSLTIIIDGQACNTENGMCVLVYEEIPITIQK